VIGSFLPTLPSVEPGSIGGGAPNADKADGVTIDAAGVGPFDAMLQHLWLSGIETPSAVIDRVASGFSRTDDAGSKLPPEGGSHEGTDTGPSSDDTAAIVIAPVLLPFSAPAPEPAIATTIEAAQVATASSDTLPMQAPPAAVGRDNGNATSGPVTPADVPAMNATPEPVTGAVAPAADASPTTDIDESATNVARAAHVTSPRGAQTRLDGSQPVGVDRGQPPTGDRSDRITIDRAEGVGLVSPRSIDHAPTTQAQTKVDLAAIVQEVIARSSDEGTPADDRRQDSRDDRPRDRRAAMMTPLGDRMELAAVGDGLAVTAHATPRGQHADDLLAEPRLTRLAAPAFAGHVALDSLSAGPRLITAPGVAAHLDAAPTVMDRELPGQIVQAIRLQVAAGGGDALVRLQPHLLGELVVSIRVSEGVVTAALQSDTPAVRQWIETHEASLRTSLADHGLQLDRLVVTGAPRSDDGEETGARDGRERDQAEEEQRRARRNKQRTGNQATFEVFA